MNVNSLQDTLYFFLIISAELIALFLVVSFVIAILQEYVPASTVQRVLAGRGVRGNVVGAAFGALTPFCSCSTVPVTAGLLSAGAPFGATMSFLLASPLMNPVILGLFAMLFGWQMAVFYGLVTFVLAVAMGAVWEQMGLQCYVKNVRVSGLHKEGGPTDLRSRLKRAGWSSFGLFRNSIPYLLIGAAIGSLIYGVVPGTWIARVAGPDNPIAIPIAAAVGVPMYIRVETLLPIGLALNA